MELTSPPWPAFTPKTPTKHIRKPMEKYIVEVYSNVTYWKNENGQCHRLGGLPAIEYADGYKYYYENGKFHRLGGLPAVEWVNGYKAYWENGQRHRLGGLPAVEWVDGSKEYWENGKQLTEAKAKRETCAGRVVTIEGKEYILTPKVK